DGKERNRSHVFSTSNRIYNPISSLLLPEGPPRGGRHKLRRIVVKSTLKAVRLVSAVCVLAWSLQPALQAADGVLVTEKTTTGGKTETHQIQVEKTRMRAEVSGPNGEPMAVIFDGTKQVLWIL